MTMRNYLILCAAVAVVTSLSVLFVPGLSEAIETALLGFLASNASA